MSFNCLEIYKLRIGRKLMRVLIDYVINTKNKNAVVIIPYFCLFFADYICTFVVERIDAMSHVFIKYVMKLVFPLKLSFLCDSVTGYGLCT